MDQEEQNGGHRGFVRAEKEYAISGKIMLSAILILFTVVLLILCLHIYARCFLALWRRHRRASNLVIYGEQQQNPGASVLSRGLEVSVLRSLPVFLFSTKTHQDPIECAVCLSEFEEKENGRTLPNCKHSFHIDCIDMWFQSHSTCPLCRAPVVSEMPPAETLVSVAGGTHPETISNAQLCSSCQTEPSSSASRRKPLGFGGVRIEVPRRDESIRVLEEELGFWSPAAVSPSGQGLKSPGSRILSLKRILSRDRRSGTVSICGFAPETDLECGDEQAAQAQR